jgi:hypothetical protein
MSTEEELKWMTKRYSWRYIPFRYQAMVATIVAAFLYYHAFELIFVDTTGGTCGSYFRPRLDSPASGPRGWFFDNWSNKTNCWGTFAGTPVEFLLTFLAIAVCGLVMRRAIKRENASV